MKYRDISPLECSYLASDSRQRSIFVNQFIVEGEGQLDLATLRSAVYRAADANPGIRLRLKGRWAGRYWDDSGAYPSVTVSHSDWQAQDNQFIPSFDGRLLDCRKSACAEVILLQPDRLSRSGEDTQRLVFRVHHAICDGAGTLHWIEEVFRALRGEAVLGSDGRLCEWDVARSYNVLKQGLDAKHWLPVKNDDCQEQLFESHWLRFSIPRDTPKVLARLIYLFAQLAWQYQGDGHVCFRIPSDLRRLLEDGDIHMGNLTGAIDIEVRRDDSLNSIYQRLLKAKRRNHDLSVFPKNLAIVKWLPQRMFSPQAKYYEKQYASGFCNITAIVSHMAGIDLARLSSTAFQAKDIVGIPIPIEGVSASCGIMQSKDNISVCLSMPKRLVSFDDMNMLVRRIQDAVVEDESAFTGQAREKEKKKEKQGRANVA